MTFVASTNGPSSGGATHSGAHPPRGVDHVHDHDTPHHHGADGHVHVEAKAPTAPSRAVMIDVGATKGALILDAAAELEGIEVEIHPVSEPSKKTHVWVLPREGRDGVVYAAIFPSLDMGPYAVLHRSGEVAFVVDVPPNTVTHASWA